MYALAGTATLDCSFRRDPEKTVANPENTVTNPEKR